MRNEYDKKKHFAIIPAASIRGYEGLKAFSIMLLIFYGRGGPAVGGGATRCGGGPGIGAPRGGPDGGGGIPVPLY